MLFSPLSFSLLPPKKILFNNFLENFTNIVGFSLRSPTTDTHTYSLCSGLHILRQEKKSFCMPWRPRGRNFPMLQENIRLPHLSLKHIEFPLIRHDLHQENVWAYSHNDKSLMRKHSYCNLIGNFMRTCFLIKSQFHDEIRHEFL